MQLYAVGTTGDGSAATQLLSTTTDADGDFTLSGLTCPSPTTPVYYLATGGNPGLSAGTNNPNLALMAAVGPCGSLTTSSFTVINELTTVAAVYALAPFIASPTSIGSSPANSSNLAANFTLASQYVNINTGSAPGTNVPAGSTVPVAELNTLGDILAVCVNSAGGTAGDNTSCGNLFSLTTPVSAAPPTNTIASMFNIALNPTLNTQALFNLPLPTAPFQPQTPIPPANFQVSFFPLQVSPTSLTFPSATAGITSAPQTVTVENNSTQTAQMYISIMGENASDFAQTNNCQQSAYPGYSCTIQVTTTPNGSGDRNAFLVFTTGSGSTLYMPLDATAAPASSGPHGVLSEYYLQFSLTGVARDLTLTNTGAAYLTTSNITTSTNNFVTTNNCGAGLEPNASCTITVFNYSPMGLNGVNASYDQLSFATNDPEMPQSIVVASPTGIAVTPSNISFPGIVVGQSATTTVTLTGGNLSTDPVSISTQTAQSL